MTMNTVQKLDLAGMPILVVEDDPTSAALLTHILTKYGGIVHTAGNGREGLERFESLYFPLVITDIYMPEMDGIELAGRIRALDRHTQIIATSANRETDCLLSAIEIGFSDYILKPIQVDKFLLAVSHCCEIISTREQLENERAKFKNVVESMGESLAIKDLDLRIVYQNPAMTAAFGDLTGQHCYTMWDLDEPCRDCPTVLTLADGLSHSSCRDYVFNNRAITVESTTSPLKDAHSSITGTIEIIRDVSERTRIERMIHNIACGVSAKVGADYLHSLTNYLTETLEMDFALVGTLNAAGDRVETQAFSRKGISAPLFSYELQGTPCEQVITKGIQVFKNNVTGQFPEDADLRALSITSYCGAPLTDSHGAAVGVLCTFHSQPITQPKLVSDIISIFGSRAAAELERLKNEKLIRELAFYDPLTGLANRRLFEDRLQRTIAKSRRYDMNFALITLDLDFFKTINDTLGHEAGDQVLIEAGRRIQSCCKRDLDTISRTGGDEFCIIVTDCDSAEMLEAIVQRLLQEFSKPFTVMETELRLTASIGICMFPDGGVEAKQLEIASDRAMYSAKKAGRNTYRFWIPYPEPEDSND